MVKAHGRAHCTPDEGAGKGGAGHAAVHGVGHQPHAQEQQCEAKSNTQREMAGQRHGQQKPLGHAFLQIITNYYQ